LKKAILTVLCAMDLSGIVSKIVLNWRRQLAGTRERLEVIGFREFILPSLIVDP
jgi:hypothetical protein